MRNTNPVSTKAPPQFGILLCAALDYVCGSKQDPISSSARDYSSFHFLFHYPPYNPNITLIYYPNGYKLHVVVAPWQSG